VDVEQRFLERGAVLPAGSTSSLTTSAPTCPSSFPVVGAATTRDRSSTRMPSSGALRRALVAGPATPPSTAGRASSARTTELVSAPTSARDRVFAAKSASFDRSPRNENLAENRINDARERPRLAGHRLGGELRSRSHHCDAAAVLPPESLPLQGATRGEELGEPALKNFTVCCPFITSMDSA
jgi:hypothetical protein